MIANRYFHTTLLFVLGGLLGDIVPIVAPCRAEEKAPRLNVLFIAVDDLRPRLACYGEPNVKTPNIDRLAAEGLVFRRAYCQMAACNPSRCSLLTSRRPDTTTVFGNKKHFREALPDVVTLPQQFKLHGYHTQSLGKIFHGTLRSEKHTDPVSWTVPEWRPPHVQYASPEGVEVIKRLYAKEIKKSKRSVAELMKRKMYRGLVWEAPDVPDSALMDGQVADKAIEVLRKVKDRPFFLGVGFFKPHAPYVAPKKYFDLYKLDDIVLPKNSHLPEDVPALAHNDSKEVRNYHGFPKSGPVPEKTQREVILAYNACVSYVDAQIGRIFEQLDRLGLRDKTVIVLWGDHGYHLSHNGLWGKNTNFEASARVPLIVSVPGMKSAGKRTDAMVELVDLYPTLCDVCGVPPTEGLQGASFAPVLEKPDRPWKTAAFTQHPRPLYDPKASMGHSIRTDRYRLTEWTGPRLKKPVYELYDYQTDPGETVNLADRPEYTDQVTVLTKRLHAGWQAAVPKAEK
ncbi:MAG: sulfatase [Pirellulales bacterium]|nr:sulfatase [Pirellulales bacterium]